MSATLFHFSFAVSDLDQARRYYGEILQRALPRRPNIPTQNLKLRRRQFLQHPKLFQQALRATFTEHRLGQLHEFGVEYRIGEGQIRITLAVRLKVRQLAPVGGFDIHL